MSAPVAIAIFAENKPQENYLAELVRMGGYLPELGGGAAPVVLAAKAEFPVSEGQAVLRLDKVTKAATVIERLRTLVALQSAPPAEVSIGDAVLDTLENLWLRPGAEAVRLTEKETSILLCLKESGGKAVKREELLHSVWAYSPDAETHTLETHIYRLRQKIEKDPSVPSVLLTDGDGYRLAF